MIFRSVTYIVIGGIKLEEQEQDNLRRVNIRKFALHLIYTVQFGT